MTELPGRLGSLRARDIMTDKVVVLSEEQSLQEAANTLIEQRITGAPVVNGDGIFVGLLSLADLAHPRPEQSPREQHSSALPWQWIREPAEFSGEGQSPGAGRVSQRMSRQIVSVRETAPLVEIARTMCKGHWHRVAVVDDAGCLCGIVSTMDVLAALVNAADEAG